MDSRLKGDVLERIAVIGTGACTAVGHGAPAVAAAVRAGIAGMAAHPYMIDVAGKPMTVCACPGLPIELSWRERLQALAVSAASEAIGAWRRVSRVSKNLVVLLALPEHSPDGLPLDEEWLTARVVERAGLRDAVVRSHGLAGGHAGGVRCIELALSVIARDPTLLCLVGGVDSYIEANRLECLDRDERLHSERTIWGLSPGEGSGFCLLASYRTAVDHGLPPLGEVVSVASDVEPVPLGSPGGICVGEGLSRTFKKALSVLDAGKTIDQTICDMNGEPYRADEYGFSVLRASRFFAPDAECLTPADCWGDVGSASGPLCAVLAMAAWQKGYAAGPRTLVYGSSDGGLRGAMVLSQVPAS